MKDKKSTYQPIDCGLYDHIEVWAMYKKMVSIQYKLDASDKLEIIIDQILTTKTLNKEEFIILESGLNIRLDFIIKIEDVDFRIGTGCALITN